MTTNYAPTREDTLPTADHQLVDADELRTRLFGSNPPSPRWIRDQTKRGVLPSFKIGRLRRYDIGLARAALVDQCLIPAKTAKRKGGAA